MGRWRGGDWNQIFEIDARLPCVNFLIAHGGIDLYGESIVPQPAFSELSFSPPPSSPVIVSSDSSHLEERFFKKFEVFFNSLRSLEREKNLSACNNKTITTWMRSRLDAI